MSYVVQGLDLISGHAGYSDPIDEQTFLVNTINKLQERPEWNSTAVIIAYDDSDGWYDHVVPPLVSQSMIPTMIFFLDLRSSVESLLQKHIMTAVGMGPSAIIGDISICKR